jgi:hypothetical protein
MECGISGKRAAVGFLSARRWIDSIAGRANSLTKTLFVISGAAAHWKTRTGDNLPAHDDRRFAQNVFTAANSDFWGGQTHALV